MEFQLAINDHTRILHIEDVLSSSIRSLTSPTRKVSCIP